MFRLFERKTQSLSMADAINALKEDPAIRLIDVRTPEEYRQGHIPGSISLPLDRIEEMQTLMPDKSTPLFVYCLSGARSNAACRALVSLGYTQITNIGGINAYRGALEH